MAETSAADVVAALRRWEDAGAVWHVLERRGSRVTVGLWTCTGDELVDRLEAEGPALDAFLTERAEGHPRPDARGPDDAGPHGTAP